MSKPVKIAVIGAGSAQFSMTLLKDICLTEEMQGSLVALFDTDEDRLDAVFRIGQRYAEQSGSSIKFEKSVGRIAAIKDADYVINTAFVLGHHIEAEIRHLALEKFGYPYFAGHLGNYHQLFLMLEIANEIKTISPDAWLLQLSNPVFEGCTLIHRQTGIKVCGLCNGFQGYRDVAETIGLDLNLVEWNAPGINHDIWLLDFKFQGKDAYKILDQWIESKSEEFWKAHRADKVHETQMSRCAISQYHMFGKLPIGDTVRQGGWWYDTDIEAKKYWYGQPWGGPDNHNARDLFVIELDKHIERIREWSKEPGIDLLSVLGKQKSNDQTINIINALVNNKEGCFQVNIPNNGTIKGIPDNVVIETQAIINQQGIKPVGNITIPENIMFNRILPDWLSMERSLRAFENGDRKALLYNLLVNRQTRSYEIADVCLCEIMQMNSIVEKENLENIQNVSKFFT